MTRGAKAFIDTNVLVRAFHEPMDQHAETKALIERLWDDGAELWISRQVLREYLVQVTHPKTFAQPLSLDQILMQAQNILSLFQMAEDSAEVTTQLFSLLKTYPTQGKQIHDANIVATMLANGIDHLATLNTGHMKRFSPRIILVPLTKETT
jgi:predicted nucleic acid-binding protein